MYGLVVLTIPKSTNMSLINKISCSFKNLQFHETEQYVYNSIFAYFINLQVPKDEETKCFPK